MSAEGSFFSRWSQRKALVRQGAEVPAEPEKADAPPLPLADALPQACLDEPASGRSGLDQSQAGLAAANPAAAAETVAEPPPTLAEAQALTPASDFSRFVAPGVDSSVKNAALKQLFTDPHFNVMDGLDTYIDDYGKPSPLPASMLRKMVQAHALGLFDDDPPAAPQPRLERDAEPGLEHLAETLAQTDAMPESLAANMTETHENADLRLQPHDAAGRSGPEPSPGPDAGRTG